MTVTRTEYVSAASLVYNPTNLSGTGFKLLIDPTGALVTTVDPAGAIGAAFVDSNHNIIVAFQGTTSSAQAAVDNAAGSGADPSTLAAFQEADAFVTKVGTVANKEGYNLSKVTVTGHSLGGMLAEYAAMMTGVGGASFGATGLGGYTSDRLSHGFTNYVDYGDEVGNIGSDTSLPITTAAIEGKQAHYGTVVEVGNSSDAPVLSTLLNLESLGSSLPSSLKSLLAADQGIVATDHTISHYVSDMAALIATTTVTASGATIDTVSATEISKLLLASKTSMMLSPIPTTTTAAATAFDAASTNDLLSSILKSSMAPDPTGTLGTTTGTTKLAQPLSASDFSHVLAQQLTATQHALLIKDA